MDLLKFVLMTLIGQETEVEWGFSVKEQSVGNVRRPSSRESAGLSRDWKSREA